MSILGSIMTSILGGRAQPAPPPSSPPRDKAPTVAPTPPAVKAKAEPPPAAAEPPAKAPPPTPTPEVKAKAQPQPPKPQGQTAHAGPSPAPARQVDIAAVLDARAADAAEELNWRKSIVDLMKLLKLDSSLAARKALAKELNYSGDASDSAAMNVWLHKQVMARLVQGGGKLPADVKH